MWSALSSGKYTESPVDRPEMTEGGRDGGMKDRGKKEINEKRVYKRETGTEKRGGSEGLDNDMWLAAF